MSLCPVLREPFKDKGDLQPQILPCSHSISRAGLKTVRPAPPMPCMYMGHLSACCLTFGTWVALSNACQVSFTPRAHAGVVRSFILQGRFKTRPWRCARLAGSHASRWPRLKRLHTYIHTRRGALGGVSNLQIHIMYTCKYIQVGASAAPGGLWTLT